MNLLKIQKTILYRSEENNDLLNLSKMNIDDLLTANFGKNINIIENSIYFTKSLFSAATLGTFRFIDGGEVHLEKSTEIYRLRYSIDFHKTYIAYLVSALIVIFLAFINKLEPLYILYFLLGIISCFIILAGFCAISAISFSNLLIKAINISGGKEVDKT